MDEAILKGGNEFKDCIKCGQMYILFYIKYL